MNRNEYLDLQTKIKNHFTSIRLRRLISFASWTLSLIYLTFLWSTSIFLPLGQSSLDLHNWHDVWLLQKILLPIAVISIIYWCFLFAGLRVEENNILNTLSNSYARNLSIDQVMYLPEFEKFFPCLDLDLAPKRKKIADIFDLSSMD